MAKVRTRRTIMILGGGLMQIPAIRAAHELGLRVVVADGRDSVPGRREADHFLNIDLKQRDALLEAAREIKKTGGLHSVFTAGTDFSASVAWITQNLGLPGIKFDTAMNATDKVRMRECFAKAGVNSTRFTGLEKGDDPLRVLDVLNFPLVVKPVDNMGARGIRRIDNERELCAYVPSAIQFSRTGRAIVEEFIPGPEYSLDALVQGDSIKICGFADRHIFFPPYFVEMGHTIPTAIDDDRKKCIVAMFEKGIRALGIDCGAAKGDIKESPDGPVIGEIAARLSGGYMSGWSYPYSSGVELTRQAIRISLGEVPADLFPRWSMVSAERAYISIPGTIASIDGLELAEKMPGVRQVLPRVKAGDSVIFPTNNVQKCGNVISQAPMRQEAILAAERAVQSIFVRLSPSNPETAAFLFTDCCDWAPSAFEILDAENAAFLAELEKKESSGKHKSGQDFPYLPGPERETVQDWHASPLNRELERLREPPFAAAVKTLNGTFPARKIWYLFLKGGKQALVWAADTLEENPSFLKQYLHD